MVSVFNRKRSGKINHMKLFATEITAICHLTNRLIKWGGPNVPGIDEASAQEYCQQNGLGYCKVIGELICEIPCKDGSHEPDFSKMIDYEKTSMN